MQLDTIPSKKREDYVDVLRAIAIFLVIVGHCRMMPNSVNQWIYSFHMPLFFIIYGCTYNFESHKTRKFCSKDFIIGKFKRLYVPCLLWAIVYSHFSFKNLAMDLYATHTTLRMGASLSSLWFLSCMFVATIIFELICEFSSKRKWSTMSEIILCLIVFWGGYLLPKIKYGYPLCADIALVAVIFIMTGHLGFQRLNNWLNGKSTILCLIIAIATGLISIILNPYNFPYLNINQVEMASGTYSNIYLFYVRAIMASASIWGIAKLITKWSHPKIVQLLVKIGGSTLGILVLHKPIIRLIARAVYTLHFSTTFVCIMGLLSSVFVLYLSYLITTYSKKYIPAAYGELK